MFIILLTTCEHSFIMFLKADEQMFIKGSRRVIMNTNTKKHYRIKSRFRFTIFVVIMMLTLITTTNTALGLYNAAADPVDEFISVEICYGDTLWDIANTYMSDIDTRTAVHKICKVNDITASDLYPGLTIQVPVL